MIKRDNMKIIWFLGVLYIITIIVSMGCISSKNDTFTTSKEISPGLITSLQLKEMLKKKDFVLINVHTPYAGEIEGTDYNIPYNEISSRIKEIVPNGAKIVVYCRSGAMSSYAYYELKKIGYENVYDLKEGMNNWKLKGGKLIYKN